MNSEQISELQRLQACYRQLWLHVHDVHRYAHRRDATAWHDAWTMPDSQQVTA